MRRILRPKKVPQYKLTIAPEKLAELSSAVERVRANAYEPYSKYMVAAGILTASGRIYTGCNVECADYLGTHAEEAALADMVKNGERLPEAILVHGGLETFGDPHRAPPCGSCRQKIMEFAQLSGIDIPIIVESDFEMAGRPALVCVYISDLLPGAFGPASIGIDVERYRR